MRIISIIIGFVILVIVGVFAYGFIHKTPPVKAIHFHAGFQVYKDGTLVNFRKSQYMHDEPCTLSQQKKEHEDEQLEKAHLHEMVPDVVHVHREGATWGDLFKNLKYPIDATGTGYVNGKAMPNVLSQAIHPYDILVLFIGNKPADVMSYLTKAVTKDHIVKIEHTSEQCGT